MSLGDIFRLALIGEGRQGQQLVNVFHYRCDSLPLIGNGEGLTAAWIDQCLDLYLATFAPGALLSTLSVRGVTDPTYGYDLDVNGHPAGTQGSGDELPPMNSVVIKWETGLIGRSYRGRTYFWPMSEGSQSNGVITSTYQTAMQDFGNSAINLLNILLPQNGAWRLVVHSPTLNVNTPVTRAVVRSQIHLQRRRASGSGS